VRHHPSEEDIQMFDFLAEIEVPTIVALTKVDKLKPREVAKRVHEIAVALRLEDDQMIPFSAETNQGRDDLAEALMSLIKMPSWRTASAEIVNDVPEEEGT
jgi:GTP-binding protein